MFSQIKWSEKKIQPRLNKPLTNIQLNKVRALLDNCFIGTRVCIDVPAMELLKSNILTLVNNDSPNREYHGVYDLVVNKMPYILFNNNMWFINMYWTASKHHCPIDTLCKYYVQYMQKFRKQKDFVLWS